MIHDRILDLIGSLSEAIWRRARQDPTFDLLYHFTHAEEYTPVTPEEIDAWSALTSPDNYLDLCAFVAGRRRISAASGYALTIDSLLLAAARLRQSRP
jgi:hypothetical protein